MAEAIWLLRRRQTALPVSRLERCPVENIKRKRQRIYAVNATDVDAIVTRFSNFAELIGSGAIVFRCINSMEIPRLRNQVAQQWRQVFQMSSNQVRHLALPFQYAIYRQQTRAQ